MPPHSLHLRFAVRRGLAARRHRGAASPHRQAPRNAHTCSLSSTWANVSKPSAPEYHSGNTHGRCLPGTPSHILTVWPRKAQRSPAAGGAGPTALGAYRHREGAGREGGRGRPSAHTSSLGATHSPGGEARRGRG